MTMKRYYSSRELSGTATIVAVNLIDGQTQIELNQTLFAPKGGGQLCDLGTIDGSSVLEVRYDGGESILHVLPGEAANVLIVGQHVTLAVDATRRMLNSRLHTAGHLVAQVAERIVPNATAVQGHHWPGESRVELIVDEVANLNIVQQQIANAVNALIAEDLAVHCTDDQIKRRSVTIQGFAPLECGGTHVASLGALERIVLRGAKLKKGRLRIGYECE